MFSGICLGMNSFTASLHKVDECEINGLPRLPHSINILGRFEKLKCIDHPNLCKYVDAKRDKHERVVLTTEYYQLNWDSEYPNISSLKFNRIIDVFINLVSAIEHLHRKGIVVRNISPKNLYWTKDDNIVKLGNYGIFYVTNCGLDIDFPIGNVLYLPPEALVIAPTNLSCYRTDIWSIGMLLLKAIVPEGVFSLFADVDVITAFHSGKFSSYLETIRDLIPGGYDLDSRLSSIVYKCLFFDVHERISISRLKEELKGLCNIGDAYVCRKESVDPLECLLKSGSPMDACNSDVRTMYHLWTLAGGDLWRVHEQLCDDQGKLPAILTLPIVINKDGESHWSTKIANVVKRPFSDVLYPLPMSKLMERLEKLSRAIVFQPQLKLVDDFKPFDFSEIHFNNIESKEERIMRSQTIWVKETDFEYQFRRIIKFKRLLRGYPLTRNSLLKETSYDIPPLLRSDIWPLLLGVNGNEATQRYMTVQGMLLNEKSASQISVDLPRCHSYDELIVSCTGQLKLGRILHAWLIHHPGLEYTQGMDSLCAVFTRLMFNNEALAFACLEAFVDRFMSGLFCSSHGQALTEYCTILQQLLAFHKPDLSQAVNIFSITGFTASWIYTGFAHSLPLDKTIRLWDTVILGEPSFLMMVFIALLGQLDQESGFSSQATEQVFSVLSNLPEFDLDKCRLEAIDLAKKTPPSLAFRPVYMDSVVRSSEILPNNIGARISLDDLLLLIGESVSDKGNNVFSPFSFDPHQLPPPILIDLRKKENFEKGSVPGSINMPVMSASPHTTFSELESLNARSMINSDQSSVKVIIGTVDDSVCDMVAKIFIGTYRLQYVSILKGGINEVRSRRPDILIVTH